MVRVRFPSLSLLLWDEAAVACQSHKLNVEGSNPSPTTFLTGMVELVDTVVLGTMSLSFASSSLVTCKKI